MKENLSQRKSQLIDLCSKNLNYAKIKDDYLSAKEQDGFVLANRDTLKRYIEGMKDVICKAKNVETLSDYQSLVNTYKIYESLISLDNAEIY